MSRMFLASGEAGATGASPPLPASAVPVSTSRREASADAQAVRTSRPRRGARAVAFYEGVPERTRVQLPAGVGETLRGLRQRRRPAARAGLPARGRRARLRAAAGPRGAARLLALAVALPRRRRHVPAERQRGRRLRARRPADRRDEPAACERREQDCTAPSCRARDRPSWTRSPRRRCRPAARTPERAFGPAVRELDRLAVDEHRLPRARTQRPSARPRADRVELVLGAVLDQDLPALVLERHEVGAGERHQVADQLRGGAGSRRFDPDGGNGGPPRRRREPGYLSRRATKPRRARPGPRRAPRA